MGEKIERVKEKERRVGKHEHERHREGEVKQCAAVGSIIPIARRAYRSYLRVRYREGTHRREQRPPPAAGSHLV